VRTVQVLKLTEEGAAIILQTAIDHARKMGLAVNVAVVDDGGFLMAFRRMDAVRLYTIPTALAKARSAALMQAPSGKGRASGAVMTDHHAIALTLAVGADSVVTFPGGVPIRVNEQVVGGIGVSGTKDEDCRTIAEAAATSFQP
jgi:glc operon protein GlcG